MASGLGRPFRVSLRESRLFRRVGRSFRRKKKHECRLRDFCPGASQGEKNSPFSAFSAVCGRGENAGVTERDMLMGTRASVEMYLCALHVGK